MCPLQLQVDPLQSMCGWPRSHQIFLQNTSIPCTNALPHPFPRITVRYNRWHLCVTLHTTFTYFVVSLGCYNKYHRLGGLNNKHVFLIALEAGSLRKGCQHGWVFREVPLPGLQIATSLLYYHIGEGEQVWSLYPFNQSHHGDSTPMTSSESSYLPKPPHLSTITPGIKASTYDSWSGDTNTLPQWVSNWVTWKSLRDHWGQWGKNQLGELQSSTLTCFIVWVFT